MKKIRKTVGSLCLYNLYIYRMKSTNEKVNIQPGVKLKILHYYM